MGWDGLGHLSPTPSFNGLRELDSNQYSQVQSLLSYRFQSRNCSKRLGGTGSRPQCHSLTVTGWTSSIRATSAQFQPFSRSNLRSAAWRSRLVMAAPCIPYWCNVVCSCLKCKG